MKIKLPKTLAEPGTIPWPTIVNGNVLAMSIVEAIHHFFRGAEKLHLIPTDDWDAWGKTQYSAAELLDILTMIAMDAGAETAKATEVGHSYGDKFQGRRLGKKAWAISGFAFSVTFTVKNNPKKYFTAIDFWFDPKRRTIYR